MLKLLDKLFGSEKKKNIKAIKDNAINEKGEYLSCRYLQGGVTFMHTSVRACCSNKQGVFFVDNYHGNPLDWKIIANNRKNIIENCKKGIIPQNCVGCVDLEKKKWEENTLIDDIFLNYWDHCNCGCVYCIQCSNGVYLETEKKPSRYYSVLDHINYLYDNNMVSKNAHIELVGGDLTVLDEADTIINKCLDYGVGRMSFHSSCIYYSDGIERALKEAPEVDFDFSLDCATPELYKKIKRIDAFNQVVDNLKRYLASTEKAQKALIAKYIIIDGLNDNVEEVNKWLDLIYSIGIRRAKIDVNFKKYFPEFHHPNPTVPPHYYQILEHFKKKINEYGIQDCCWEFSKQIFENGGLNKD